MFALSISEETASSGRIAGSCTIEIGRDIARTPSRHLLHSLRELYASQWREEEYSGERVAFFFVCCRALVLRHFLFCSFSINLPLYILPCPSEMYSKISVVLKILLNAFYPLDRFSPFRFNVKKLLICCT